MYEYGYTLSNGQESQGFVLGTVAEHELAAKQREVEAANKLERLPRGPTIGGRCEPATHWVRPAHQSPEISGSRFTEHGPVTLGCMSPEARDLLDDIMDAYRAHYNPETHTAEPEAVYQFAYWLTRWSGLVQRAAIPRRKPDQRLAGELTGECPTCRALVASTNFSVVITGIMECPVCKTVSCNYAPTTLESERED